MKAPTFYESGDHPFTESATKEAVCVCGVLLEEHHERPTGPPARGEEVLRFRPERDDLAAAMDQDVHEEYSVTVGISERLPESCDLVIWGWIRGEWIANAAPRPVVHELLKRVKKAEKLVDVLVEESTE